jgi:4-aminobutyrate aminotransferase
MTEADTTDYCLHELKRLLKSQSAPEETACIVMEPVLGEGGYVVPPVEFMKELRALCDQHGILLVADEVQSGVGRTGKWFAMEHFGVQPDVLITAKGLASGQTLEVLATDPGSTKDFAAWSKSTGNEMVEQTVDGGVFRFVLRKK